MKPCTRMVRPASYLMQDIGVGPVIAKISGSVKKLGDNYRDANVVLFNKANMRPIAIQQPKEDGSYNFQALNTNINTFIVAFDQKQQFNAVIQDNVVPK